MLFFFNLLIQFSKLSFTTLLGPNSIQKEIYAFTLKSVTDSPTDYLNISNEIISLEIYDYKNVIVAKVVTKLWYLNAHLFLTKLIRRANAGDKHGKTLCLVNTYKTQSNINTNIGSVQTVK
jgi:hypothetical protein